MLGTRSRPMEGADPMPDCPAMTAPPPSRARPKPKSQPWTRPNPKPRAARSALTDAQKAAARQRADEAGRCYPNLVDNMWAKRHVNADGTDKPR